MLSRKDYPKFNLKMNRIIQDCIVKDPSQEPYEFSRAGNCTQTQDNIYYYNSKAKNHRESLIELCVFLPKMKNSRIGTAGCIVFPDLISDAKLPGLLKKEFVVADHFINLLVYNGLCYTEKSQLSNGNFITHIHLDPSLENRLQEKSGQEPSDD